MRLHTLPRAVAATLLVGSLALAGCAPEPEKKPADDEPMPLEQYQQVMWGSSEWHEAQAKENYLKREEVVAKCMVAAGFEYIPRSEELSAGAIPAGEAEDVPQDPDGLKWGTVEYAQRYGYEMVVWPGMLTGPSAEPDPGSQVVDPNDEYLASLTESERAAYDEAMWGDFQFAGTQIDEDGNEVEAETDPEKMGCQGKAELAFGVELAWEDPEFAELSEQLEQFEVTLENNEDLAILERDWSDCMTSKGFPFATRDDAYNHMSDVSQAELYPNDSEEEPTQEMKDAFHVTEVKQAVADFSCINEVDYFARTRIINVAAEQKFIDDHKPQLDAMMARYSHEQ